MPTYAIHNPRLELARSDYRRVYDRLYVRSMRAGSAEECARIDEALARANAKLAAAEAAAMAAS